MVLDLYEGSVIVEIKLASPKGRHNERTVPKKKKDIESRERKKNSFPSCVCVLF